MREEIILKRLRAGDPAGLEALMERYAPYVSAVVWGILRFSMTPQDGEEVASDVFLAAWRQPEALRTGHVKGWLGAVARNKAKNKLRELGHTLPLEEDVLELPDPEDLGERMERAEEIELVRRAVEAMPEPDRELFLRHYYYAQPLKDIAAAMDLKEATVKTRLRRGRLRLRKTILGEGDAANEAEYF